MINFESAKEIALEYLDSVSSGHEIALDEKATVEYDFGWVFFYQTKAYLETGSFSQMLTGNAPFIVDKSNGRVTVTGTAEELEHYLDEYRSNGKISSI